MTRPSRPSGATRSDGPKPFAPLSYGHFEQLTERVFLWRNIVNSTVFVGDHGVAVVDTQVNHGLARRLIAAIQQRFGKPIRYAINTHYHWDHTNGNPLFAAAGATLLCNRATAAAMVEKAPRQKGFLAGRGFELGPDPLIPTLAIEDQPHLDLGGLTLDLRRGSSAETDDPTLVWCPQQRVLAAGDTVMTGSFPIFGQPSQREGLEDDRWLAALDEVRDFGATAVAPGHGPVARADELATLERIMRHCLDEVRRLHGAGCDLPELLRRFEAALPDWMRTIPEVWGTPRYAALRVWAGLVDLGEPGWQHVKPSTIPRRAPTAQACDLSAWQQVVESALEGGDAALAVGAGHAATEAHPADPAAWTLLARALIEASRGIASVLEKGDCFHAAKQAIAEALARDATYGPALLLLARFHALMAWRNGDDTRLARRLLDQAMDDERLSRADRAQVQFCRGMCERTDGNEAAARTQFMNAIRHDPACMPAHLAMQA